MPPFPLMWNTFVMSLFNKLGVLFRCWWNRFFPSWNERYMYQSSSIPTGRMQRPSTYLQMLLGTVGYGVYFNGAWFRGDWLPHLKPRMRSIQWQELFAIVAAACTCGHLLQGQRITVHCDNMAIVQANQSARHQGILHFLQTLFFITDKQFYCPPGPFARQTELQCGCSLPQPVVTVLCPCLTGQPTANPSTSSAGRALSRQMEKLLSRALAPFTFHTYQTGIRRYYNFTTENHSQAQHELWHYS